MMMKIRLLGIATFNLLSSLLAATALAELPLVEIQVTRGKGKEPLNVKVQTIGAAERRP